MTDFVSHPAGVPSLASAPPSCPRDLELARCVEGTLEAEVRAGVLGHLEGCDDCREVIATVIAATGEGLTPAIADPVAPGMLRGRARILPPARASSNGDP